MLSGDDAGRDGRERQGQSPSLLATRPSGRARLARFPPPMAWSTSPAFEEAASGPRSWPGSAGPAFRSPAAGRLHDQGGQSGPVPGRVADHLQECAGEIDRLTQTGMRRRRGLAPLPGGSRAARLWDDVSGPGPPWSGPSAAGRPGRTDRRPSRRPRPGSVEGSCRPVPVGRSCSTRPWTVTRRPRWASERAHRSRKPTRVGKSEGRAASAVALPESAAR